MGKDGAPARGDNRENLGERFHTPAIEKLIARAQFVANKRFNNSSYRCDRDFELAQKL
jgi:hypothetical protein